MLEEIKRYDPYTDKFIKNTTTDRIEVGTDGGLYNLSISNSFGLYAKNLEELDKCDYIDKSTKLYTKDEVIAMFEEIQSKITEKSYYDTTILGNYEDEVRINLVELDDVNEIIIEKINSLKEDSDET